MKLGSMIGAFFELRKAYNELSRLDDAALKDIGVSRAEIKQRVYQPR